MTTDSFVKAQLALLCWRNCPAGKPFQLLKCLALIERNRVRAGWHGGDWLAIIANDATFSAYLGAEKLQQDAPPRDERLGLFPDTRDDVFQRFLWEVDKVYDGSAADPMTEGALWWAELEKADRPFFLKKIARQPKEHPRVAQVGSLTLFR